MKKTIIYFLILFVSVAFVRCSEDDNVQASGEELFPPMHNSDLDVQLKTMFTDYNTRVEYRYIKNLLPNDWYYITPVREEFVIPMSQLVLDMWIGPLLAGADKELVGVTFPKMLVYVGSPAFKLDGTRVLGQAEGGTLIRFTEVNRFNPTNIGWINTQMHTAFHEYGHIIHQRFGFPDEYRKVTPDSYTENGWRTIDDREALQRGMVSSYATKNFQEDFVELFSTYIYASDKELNNLLVDAPETSLEIAKDNEGRAIIREKLSIQIKYMHNVGIDMDEVRNSYQTKIAAIEAGE